MPPFDIVEEWFNQNFGLIVSDTERVHIQLNTQSGSFEAVILAVLYSSEIQPSYAEDTVRALMNNHLTDIDIWRNVQENDETYQRIMELLIEFYQGGKFRNKKIKFMKQNATHIANHLNGDIRNLFDQCNGNERMMLKYLREKIKGIRIKAFWLLREMRINRLWDIDGQYCCVPDKQVGKALERWHYIDSYDSNLSTHIRCSQIVWNHFHEMYDFPVLHYARSHRCNSQRRRCAECLILDCADR